ncbi:MAG: hypothetical protein JWM88_1596 [Verrucomicrobia bacterium]|nr:hypothetical protein [Verrucomicrobiota bacterium]
MKTKQFPSFCAACAGLLLLAGCATEPRSTAPQDTTKYTVENTDKFVLLDPPTQASITCTGLQERTLPDGRIEVVANIKNRESHSMHVQVNCVFKDAQGFSTGDETPFQSLTVAEKATEAVHFTAAGAAAKKYTIRVRLAR